MIVICGCLIEKDNKWLRKQRKNAMDNGIFQQDT